MPRRWTTGECWLCERTAVRVLWLGPVQWDGVGHAPLYACEPCLRRLEAKHLAALIRGGGSTPRRRSWARADCWLWCERIDVPTLLLGVVERAGQEAALTVCDSCIRHLEDKVRATLEYVPA
ncbi:hypothetical protein ACFV2X_42905 [Streptomyces sp. NPDC059679]|uniref:hypothetical protein n=1 Tax=Streptomyces sp. NPDC059679 TaxID=3346903 RepID=UPI0036CD5CB6